MARHGFFSHDGFRKKPKALWRHPLIGAEYSIRALALAETRVFGVAEPKQVFALDRSTGERLWSVTVPGSWVSGTPALYDDLVLVPFGGLDAAGAQVGGVLALDPMTGQTRTILGQRLLSQSPCVLGALLLSGTLDRFIVAINVRTGVERWRTATIGTVFPSLIAGHDARAYVIGADEGGKGARLVALDVDEGTALWRMDVGDARRPSLIVGQDAVFLINDRKATAYRSADGECLWSFEHSSPLFASALVDDVLFLGADSGVILALDVQAGAPRWQIDLGEMLLSEITVANDTLYAGTTTKLLALDASAGRTLWSFSTKNNAGSVKSVVPDEGVLYVTRAREILALTR